MRVHSIEHTQCHGTRRGVRGSGNVTRKIPERRGDRVDATGSSAANPCAVRCIRATHGYGDRRRRRAKWLGKSTDEPVQEIGQLVTQ